MFNKELTNQGIGRLVENFNSKPWRRNAHIRTRRRADTAAAGNNVKKFKSSG